LEKKAPIWKSFRALFDWGVQAPHLPLSDSC
jgi:hypothetical protein